MPGNPEMPGGAAKKAQEESPLLFSQRSRKAAASSDRKLSDHDHSTPAKHPRKKLWLHSGPASRDQVGSPDVHPHKAATWCSRAPTEVVTEEAK